jgi:peptide/nickel transport system ATP-binding protein/oligopeptide transport system ATP-binding protein
VGESGSGKSQTVLAVMGLTAANGEVGGEIRFEGQDIGHLSRQELNRIRGSKVAMIFQDPLTSLTAHMTVGAQMEEVLARHRKVRGAEAEKQIIEWLERVRIPEARRRLHQFPHELSGGMRQRVMIAMALACRPRLLVADEPTTALDVTVQAQVLDLVRRVQRELGMAVLFITHDLGVVAQVADRVAVMYAGRIVEESGVHELFAHPRHPYTAGLLGSMPNAAASAVMAKPIPGAMPSLHRLPSGCPFHPRCASADDRRCSRELPPLERTGEGRTVRCFRWAEVSAPYARVA